MDGFGGPNNRNAGNYNFHKGPLTGRTYDSKAGAVSVLYRVKRKKSATESFPESCERFCRVAAVEKPQLERRQIY